MEHKLYCNKIKQERRYRDEQRSRRIEMEEIRSQEQLKNQKDHTKSRIQELQESRRIQSKLNLSQMYLNSDERQLKINETNKKVKELLAKFKEEKVEQAALLRKQLIDEELQRKHKLQEIRQRFRLISSEELREHQNKYRQAKSKISIQLREQLETRQKNEQEYMERIRSRLRSRTYDHTIQEEKQYQLREIDKQEKQIEQSRIRLHYDEYVKDQFYPQLIQDPKYELQGKSIIQEEPIINKSRILGKLYLKELRDLPKKINKQENTVKIERYQDYLTEIRVSTQKQHRKRKIKYLYDEAQILETKSIHNSIKNRNRGDRYLIQSIKCKLRILDSD